MPDGFTFSHDIDFSTYRCRRCGLTALQLTESRMELPCLPPQQVPLRSLPTVVGPVYGWRSWQVVRISYTAAVSGSQYVDAILQGITCQVPWPAREPMVAECVVSPRMHDLCSAPYRDCACGIYATKEPFSPPLEGIAFGKVALWGRVIEHEYGYRAQYAYPVKLIWTGAFQTGSKEICERIEDRYGVPAAYMPALDIGYADKETIRRIFDEHWGSAEGNTGGTAGIARALEATGRGAGEGPGPARS